MSGIGLAQVSFATRSIGKLTLPKLQYRKSYLFSQSYGRPEPEVPDELIESEASLKSQSSTFAPDQEIRYISSIESTVDRLGQGKPISLQDVINIQEYAEIDGDVFELLKDGLVTGVEQSLMTLENLKDKIPTSKSEEVDPGVNRLESDIYPLYCEQYYLTSRVQIFSKILALHDNSKPASTTERLNELNAAFDRSIETSIGKVYEGGSPSEVKAKALSDFNIGTFECWNLDSMFNGIDPV